MMDTKYMDICGDFSKPSIRNLFFISEKHKDIHAKVPSHDSLLHTPPAPTKKKKSPRTPLSLPHTHRDFPIWVNLTDKIFAYSTFFSI